MQIGTNVQNIHNICLYQLAYFPCGRALQLLALRYLHNLTVLHVSFE